MWALYLIHHVCQYGVSLSFHDVAMLRYYVGCASCFALGVISVLSYYSVF
jgi:hypothetical protein